MEGFAELDRKLRDLPRKVQGRVLRAAARDAIKPALARARATIPVGDEAHKTYKGRLVAPGFAKRNLTVVTKLDRTGSRAFAMLGVKREAFYATLFLELGTARMPAQPWLVPAFESTQAQQVAKLAAALKRRIMEAAK